ncbi:MAG TPA: hypothetical protein VKK61_09925 [Tepidisphaeraceae bacterium]|nr:hypothetical protein [Tepidisphaeraceae bacterium]
MVVSKRERYVAIFAGAVVGLLLLDRVVITPLFTQREDLSSSIDAAQQKLAHDEQVMFTQRRLGGEWSGVVNGGLKQDASTAESQVLNSLREWSQEAGLAVGSMRPERSGEKEKDFFKITFRATGSGSMDEVSRFIWQIQTAKIPVHITDLTITSKEGSDELSLSLGVATIYLPPPNKNGQETHS